MRTPVLLVHGGAGPRRAGHGDERTHAGARAELARAIDAGWRQLADGAQAACVAAVCVLEDSTGFNAGTWAHRLTCAISATGDGEAFLRTLFAHEVHARMLHAGEDVAAAAQAALEAVRRAGGLGGAICVDARGAIAMPVTSDVMYRAWRRDREATRTAVGADDAGTPHRD